MSEVVYEPVIISTVDAITDVRIEEDHIAVTPIISKVEITPLCPNCSEGGTLRYFKTLMQNDTLEYDLPELPNQTPTVAFVNGVQIEHQITGVRLKVLTYQASEIANEDELFVYYYIT